ncbi:hypothetical protein [Salegentibacter sp. T436]|uniref:hypothetical protein n=1 Tax=Salegentibacter sp. T436 TaxID=1729720 RepID=UPI00094A1F0D|nr:hypothetical protein [Salegentibacter sp. T436]APS37431.1 hypothetical protein AO058_00365 [Salegentibacter sp. T436]
MRIAYFINLDIVQHTGIIKKVLSQIEIWKQNGFEVCLFCVTSNHNNKKDTLLSNEESVKLYFEKKGNLPFEKIKDLFNLNSVFRDVENDIIQYQPDVIYFRNDFNFPFFLKRLSKRIKLIAEINTNQVEEAQLRAKENLKGFLIYLYFRVIDPIFRKHTTGMVAVTNEISKYFLMKGHQVAVIPNSINYKRFSQNTFQTPPENKPRLVFIGSPGMPWHGLDILEELSESLPNIHFDIIGTKKEDKDNVTYHGFLSFDKYNSIINNSSAGCGSLALFRNQMDEACPLKVREYLAFNKPIIIAYKDTAFEKYGYPDWVLQLPNSKERILNSALEIENFIKNSRRFKLTHADTNRYADANVIELERIGFFKDVAKS